jgi:hypothetical protein
MNLIIDFLGRKHDLLKHVFAEYFDAVRIMRFLEFIELQIT